MKKELTATEQCVLSIFKKSASIILLKEDILKEVNLSSRQMNYILKTLVDSNKIDTIKSLKDSRKNVYFLINNRNLLTIGDIR